MAKRFYNTNRIEEDWYINLSLFHRELLRYCESKCDGAGIFSWNAKVATTYINQPVNDSDLLNIPVSKLPSGKYFVHGFCYFQNGFLSKKSPAHAPIFKSIAENGTNEDTLLNTLSDTLFNRDKEIEREREEEIEREIQAQKQILILPENEVIERLKVNQYQDKEKMMRTYGFTETEYEHAVDMFCLEPENTQKDFPEVIRHFKKWCGTKVISIKQTAEDRLINNSQREEIKRRNSNSEPGETDRLYGKI